MAEATLDIAEWQWFVGQMRGRMDRAADYLKLAVETKGREDVYRHFEDQKGPTGPWQPRSPKTQEAYANYASGKWKLPKGSGHRAKYDPNNLILVLSGRLRGSVQPRGKDGGVRVLGKDAVLLYSAVEYSRAHDQGISGRLPKREFMWLSDEGREKVADVFLGALMEGL